jgi:hypothetical protein
VSATYPVVCFTKLTGYTTRQNGNGKDAIIPMILKQE